MTPISCIFKKHLYRILHTRPISVTASKIKRYCRNGVLKGIMNLVYLQEGRVTRKFRSLLFIFEGDNSAYDAPTKHGNKGKGRMKPAGMFGTVSFERYDDPGNFA